MDTPNDPDLRTVMDRIKLISFERAICVTDGELDVPGPKILFVNRQFCELTGYTEREILGETPRVLQGPDTDREVLRKLKRDLNDTGFFQGQTYNYRKDGSRFLMAWSISSVPRSDGSIGLYVAVQQDASRNMTDDLGEDVFESHSRFLSLVDPRLQNVLKIGVERDYANTIIEVARTPLLVLNAELTVRRANRAAVAMFAESDPELVGKNFFELIQGQFDDTHLRRLIDELLPTSNPIENYEMDIDSAAGRRHLIINASQLPMIGRRSKILLSIEDVTVRQQYLRELENRSSEFVATLAHELRNPLQPIMAATSVLELHAPGDERLQSTVATIRRHADHMANIMDGLLEVSRVTAGKIQLRTAPVHLRSVLEAAVETSQSLMDERNHEFVFNCPIRPKIWVETDATRLQQCVSNLLNNAAKYTYPGGRIELVVARWDHEVEIQVRDNGIGISAEAMPRIFDMLFQEDNKLVRHTSGLGIGLTLTKGLVERMGGTLSVESAGTDRGSTFAIRLPTIDPPAETPRAEIPAYDVPRPGERKENSEQLVILVVDDQKDAATLGVMLINAWGFQAHAALNGLAALEAVRRLRPDVILLDINMPGLNGYEVMQRMREEGLHVPVKVAMTGYGGDADKQRIAEAGFDHHLIKPVNNQRLKALFESLAPQRREE